MTNIERLPARCSINMETASPSPKSPPRHSNDGSMAESVSPRGRVPAQSVTSASQLPELPSRKSLSPQVASSLYVKQFQTFMEHQRRTFDEERALWNIERMELHEKITQLEDSLRGYQAISSSQISYSIKNNNLASQDKSSFRSLLGKDGSNPTSETATGNEIWRGSKPDIQPTRTFSDPTTHYTKPGDRSRLPSIAEDTTCGRKDPSDVHTDLPKPSVSGAQMDKNLDGINFKSRVLSPASAKRIMTPQSPSPGTYSPSHLSPKTIELPSSVLSATLDPYTIDAGHTPLPRRTKFNADGASSDTDGATPTQPEIERPPLEPHASFEKVPSERSDSYFPVVENEYQDGKDSTVCQEGGFRDSEDKSRDEDPELKGPLGLNSSGSEGSSFLQELDSKLEQVARTKTSVPPSLGLDTETSPAKDEEDFEQPEPEPQLRIKRSMNFGSAFGAKTCGKGI